MKGDVTMRQFLLFALLAGLAAACTPTPGTERVTAGETVDIASAGTQLSVQRAQNGIVRPLGYSPALQAAAESHAQYLSRTGNFSHDGAGGTSAGDRVRRAGYQSCLTAENIAPRPARHPQRRRQLDGQPGAPLQHPECATDPVWFRAGGVGLGSGARAAVLRSMRVARDR
jgi:hypothetical protein